MKLKALFIAATLTSGLIANSFAGNDEALINVPTTVAVEDISTEWDMPKNMRTGNQQVNTLTIEAFDIKPASNGRFTVGFNMPATATAYVRIVDAAGNDVYFETVKGNTAYNNQVDLSAIAAGTYYLQVTQKGKTFNKRLIFN
jgi:hypothetical protein